MEDCIMISVKFGGQCKLVSVLESSTFEDFVGLLVQKWGEVIKNEFSCICSVGDMSDICLECEDDLKNLWIVCKLTKVNIVSAVLCAPICHPTPVCSPVDMFSPVDLNSSSSTCSKPNDEFSVQCTGIHNTKVSMAEPSSKEQNSGTKITSPTYDVCPYVKRKPMLSDSWADFLKNGVGSIFRGGAPEFRTELIKFSSHMGFKFIYKKNDSRYIYAICSEYINSACEWFIRAKRQSVTSFFEVYDANLIHSCIGKIVVDDNKRLGPKIMGQLLVSNVKCNTAITGKDIVLTMRGDYGFDVPYWKAHRAVEVARSELFGNYDESYDQLRWYTQAILRTNPGSVVNLEADPETHEFVRLFVAFKACIDGFKSCRPLLFIDGTFAKGRGRGILLVAIAKDGDNGLFPVGLAVVSAENEDNWGWFLEMLRDNVTHEQKISYVSDRNSGLLAAFPKVLDEQDHFFCLYHLLTNLKGHMGGGWKSSVRANLLEQLTACAYAPNKRLFDEEVAKFEEIGGNSAKIWLSKIPPEKWAVAYSPIVCRYGEMTSNAAESFNKWLLEARSLPITSMLEKIRKGLCRWFVERRKECNSWNGVLVKSKQDLWDYLVDAGRTWFVSESPSGDFEVTSFPSVQVDLHKKTCSCYQWQVTGFPCVHAVAVIRRRCDSILTYVDKFFYKNSYEDTYKVDIHPIPETMRFECQSHDIDFKILPPTLKRRPGRPKKVRQPSYGETPFAKKPKNAKEMY